MMRVALVKCPRESSGLFTENSESLALAYLAASLRKAGFEVSVLNAALRRTSETELVQLLCSGDYGLVGFNLPDPTLVDSTFRIADRLRARGFDGHICTGGHTATFHADTVLERGPAIDSVALHEGEETICELARAIQTGEDWRLVPGIVFRNGARTLRSPERALSPGLDNLPFPDRDDLPWVLANLPEAGAVPVLASRGCHFNCSFCSVRAFYEREGRSTWRRRSIDNVLDEIRLLTDTYAVDDILFVDDLFVSRSKATLRYAAEFARAVLHAGLQITFTISATVDSVDRDTFKLLRAAGLRQVFLGAESASPDVLKALNKWFTPAQISEAVHVLNELGIDSSVSYINFTPATRFHHLRENLAFFSSLGTNILQGLLNRYQVYGGTPLFQELQQSGRLTGDFPVYGYTGIDADVELVYDICQRSLGSIIELQYQLKTVDRRTFALLNGQRASSVVTEQVRCLLRNVTSGINADVAAVFGNVLDFVENAHGGADETDVGSFVHETASSVRTSCDEWLATLRLISDDILSAESTAPVLPPAESDFNSDRDGNLTHVN